MRKRAMIVGLVLVPLVTGGAVIANLASKSSTAGAPVESTTPNTTEQEKHSFSEESNEQQHPALAPHSSEESEVEDSNETSSPSTPARIESDEANSQPMLADAAEISEEPEHRLRLLAANAGARNVTSRSGLASGSFSNLGGGRGTSGRPDTSGGKEQTPENSTEETGDPSIPSNSRDDSDTGHSSSDDSLSEDPVEQSGPTLAEEISDDDYFFEDPSTQPGKQAPVRVPEPSTLILLGLGLLGCAMVSRKTRA